VSTPVTMPMPGDVSQNEGFRDVGGYVAAVRAQLDDLGRDEIEELTDGLEADLTDALRNQEIAPVVMFGAPADYAAELRSAAGLPPRGRAEGRLAGRFLQPDGLPTLLLGLREVRERALAPLITQKWWPDVRDFLVTLRPAWWLLRGYLAYQFIDQSLTGAAAVLPDGLITWLTLAVLIIGSVELGRRNWAARGRRERWLILTGNAFAVLLIVSGVGAFGPDLDTYTSTGATEVIVEPPNEGLFNAGYQVVNVFPYDKNGQPLDDVQLYDDRGRPLAPAATTYLGRDGERVQLVPTVTTDGAQAFNVFPLREQVTDPGYDPQTGNDRPWPTSGVLRPAARPDPSHPAVVPIQVPAASMTPQVSATR